MNILFFGTIFLSTSSSLFFLLVQQSLWNNSSSFTGGNCRVGGRRGLMTTVSTTTSIKQQQQQQQQQQQKQQSRMLAFQKASPLSSSSSPSNKDNKSSYDNNGDYEEKIKECKSLGLYQETPLIHSIPMSQLVPGRDVYIKLDCLQSSGSFKDRGMAYFCISHLQEAGNSNSDSNDNSNNNAKKKKKLKFIGSSGGNAGLALTTIAACKLKLDVSVIVPKTTKDIVVQKLKKLGANVTVHGDIWNQADTLARTIAKEEEAAVYASPYDHPWLWTGHSTMVDEILQQLEQQQQITTTATTRTTTNDDIYSNSNNNIRKKQLGTIITGVGGGGLLCGILEGLNRSNTIENQKDDTSISTHVIACETEGTNKFALSMKKKKIVQLDGVNSIATSLGALEVTDELLNRAQDYKGRVSTSVCTDREAVDACLQFASDHRLLVEPACGAALAVVYSKRLREEFLLSANNNDDSNNDPIVVEVCGGSGVNIELLQQWKKDFSNE